MLKDDELKNHILDLAERSFNQNIYCFSDFLSLSEQSIVKSMEKEISFIDHDFFGGTTYNERVMIRFGSEKMFGYTEDFPISVLIVKPLNPKFSDELTHRDFLGALMNLGIERAVLGDIVVKDNTACIFCNSLMASYISENIVQIKHTTVTVSIADECPEIALPELKDEEHVVASNRCDAVISKVYNLSRSQSQELLKGGMIYVDGRESFSSSLELKEGAVVSVRGFGKFVFSGFVSETRKGRIRIKIKRYI